MSGPAPELTVALAFRAVLHRAPDEGALRTYAGFLREGRDLAWLLEVLAGSEEYREFQKLPPPAPLFPLDSGPRMWVEAGCGPDELQALWDHVAATWSRLGDLDAPWSVLTEERYRAEAMDEAAWAAFLYAGELEALRLEAWFARNGLVLPAGRCVELGCGVGRITRSLARRFGAVVGLDVSAPPLRAAAARLAADGIGNVELVQVRGAGELAALAGADLFYSVISLQHSPPPIILDILARAFAGLRPGGAAFFQVPTYNPGYRYPAPPSEGLDMEMHFVPQQAVFRLADAAGLRAIEVQPDWCVGRLGEWISNTFLFVRV